MKLLVVSHACVTPVNQSFYADVAAHTGWEISLVIPSGWHTEYSRNLPITRWPDFTGPIIEAPVFRSGDIPLHLYRQTFVPLLRRLRPHAIYMHHEPYGAATAQMYLANRLVDSVPFGFYAAQNILKRYPVPFRWTEQAILRDAAFCFPVSEAARQVLQRKGYRGTDDVLPLPVDLELYQRQSAWATHKREELRIAASEFVVGYLGRLVEEKGLATLIRACSALHGRHWRLLLVGSGEYETALRAQLAALGLEEHVLFIGYVPHTEAPGWLSLFDVLVLPSETRPRWKEQFGRVIIEANACQTPVIGSDSGSIPGLIQDTGGGLIFPEGDAEALGTHLRALAGDPSLARSFGLIGEQAVRERYAQKYLAGRFAHTIQAAVKNAAAGPAGKGRE